MNEVERLQRRLDREIAARKQAEKILEDKALELYKINESLEETVNMRTVQLRQSEIKYRSIIENMQLGLLEVDLDEIIVKAYPLFCEMTGYSQQDLLGKKATDVLAFNPEEARDMIDAQNADRLEGKSGVWEIVIKHANGHPVHVLVSGAPILDVDGKVVGSIGVHYDISYQKALQSELELALEKAEAAQMAEKQFLTNMSHEIRTPLNVIIGMSELLHDSDLTSEQREYLATLSTSADLMLNLVNDLLDISRIDAGAVQVSNEPFDLSRLVDSVYTAFQLRLENVPVEMHLEYDHRPENFLIGDPKLINQVLYNLLGNAEKFTESGDITLSVQLDKEDDGYQVKFSVKDTGIGISVENQKEIFKQFTQAHRGIRKRYGGTGLGLAISERITRQMGGELDLNSRLGEGSTFSFSIYLKDSGETIQVEKKSRDLVPLRIPGHPILVVEDNLLNQKYLLTILDRWNLPFDTANNGQEAVRKFRENAYSLILMDIQMPIMDGRSAARLIREYERDGVEVPIIALSASSLRGEDESGPFTDELTKPYKPSELHQKLELYFGVTSEDRGFSLDHSILEELYQDDEEYKRDIFQLYMEIVPSEMDLLKSAIDNEDHEMTARIAHKIKPNFHMVGIPEGQVLLQKIESAARKKGSMKEIMKLMEKATVIFNESWPIIEKSIM